MGETQRLGTLAFAALLAVVVASLGMRPQASAQATAIQDGSRASLKDSAPGWAKPSNEVGTAPGSKHVDARVYLKPRDKSGLDALVDEISDPSSPHYGQFITPDQYRSRFGPTDADVNAVKKWLTGTGLRVTDVGAGNRYVAVSGNVDQAQRAFGVALKLYRYRGEQALAPAGDLSVPQRLADKVLGITGLESPAHTVHPATAGISRSSSAPPPEGFRNARPCSLYYRQLLAR